MSKRTYQQFCPLAYALDVIGERWTLLIVRELQLGPRRFSDLQRGLAGINPNLLSERLQAMEKLGIIAQVPLPPPANIMAYGLTISGRELNDALMPLAQWGMRLMPPTMPDGSILGAVPAMSAMKSLYLPNLDPHETIAAEINLEPDCYYLHLTDSEIQVVQGFADSAQVRLKTNPESLIGIARGFISVEDAVSTGMVQIRQGKVNDVARFFDQFSINGES